MVKHSYPGKFIVFDGLDGSGQSTQAELLRDFLSQKRKKVILTKEPTSDSETGKIIREVLNKKIEMSPGELQELFAKDRKEHLENLIIPALKEGTIVISDRYFFSSFAFGRASGLDLQWLMKINEEFPLPDLTFILKVDPEICIERIKRRNQETGKERTLFEEKEKLEKTWRVYQELPFLLEDVYLIDGEGSILEVFQRIKKMISQLLSPNLDE
jgi:dTMP kinase